MTDSLDPAARLHGLLDYCRQNNGSHQLAGLWASYLEVSPDSVDYVQALAQMMLLPGQVRAAFATLSARKVPVPFWFFLEPLTPIEKALAYGVRNQAGPVSQFVQRYSEGQVDRVLSASAILRDYAASPVPDGDLIDVVETTGTELADLLVNDETLEPDVRELLHALADGLRRSAQTYKMTGAEGVARERDLLVGRLRMNTGLREHVRSHPKVVEVVGRFLERTTVVATFFTTAVDAGEDVQKIIQQITG